MSSRESAPRLAETDFGVQFSSLIQLYETAPVGLCLLDRDLRYVRINRRLAEYHGRPVEDHIGRRLADVIPEIAPQAEPSLRRVIETGEPILDQERRGTTPAAPGVERHWRSSYFPIKSSDGTVTGVSIVVLEVTDLKLAEQELRRTTEQYQRLLESTSIIPWVASAETWRFTYVGPQAEDILGYPAERWYEDDFWTEHIHPEDKEFTIDYCETSSRTLNHYAFEYRMVATDGREVWLHDLVGVEFADGKPKTLRGFMIDITDRKAAEASLRLKDEQLRLVADSVPALIAYVDKDQRYRFTNVTYAKWFGQSADEIIGKHISEVLGAGYVNVLANVSSALAGEAISFETSLPKQDEGMRPILAHLTPHWNDDEVDGFFVLATDITDRKQAELRLQRAFAEIEQLKDHLEAENIYLREEIRGSRGFQDIVGESSALKKSLRKAHQVADTDTTVLILGETGTGKELIARAIHDMSKRRDRPLVKVNCAALPSTLIESELFGHEKRAFTGATHKNIGRFELADEATIFLDEIGDLDPALQTKLLRVLQDGEFERVGSSKTRKVDVRIIAATNRDLAKAMDEGKFRTDLYYRLSTFPIELPPLRERTEDIPLLAWFSISSRRGSFARRIESIAPESMDALIAYDWPGNVRELENVIEHAMILSRGPVLTIEEPIGGRSPGRQPGVTDGDQSLQTVEHDHIVSVLEACRWRINGADNAAERLALPPSTLRSRMKKLGIARPASG